MSVSLRTAAAAAVLGYTALQVLGRTAGSTANERHKVLPGDEVVQHPNAVTNHALTIPAPPEQIWPWLMQMGWHRGGYYTPPWVDRVFFPANWPSLDVLNPKLTRELVRGDTIPDGPPGTAWYVVHTARAPETLVLHSTTHVPQAWQERGARVDWTWTFQLTRLPRQGTRLQLRVRGLARPWWFAAAYVLVIVPADYFMATGMLRGLRRRACSSDEQTGQDTRAQKWNLRRRRQPNLGDGICDGARPALRRQLTCPVTRWCPWPSTARPGQSRSRRRLVRSGHGWSRSAASGPVFIAMTCSTTWRGRARPGSFTRSSISQ